MCSPIVSFLQSNSLAPIVRFLLSMCTPPLSHCNYITDEVPPKRERFSPIERAAEVCGLPAFVVHLLTISSAVRITRKWSFLYSISVGWRKRLATLLSLLSSTRLPRTPTRVYHLLCCGWRSLCAFSTMLCGNGDDISLQCSYYIHANCLHVWSARLCGYWFM